MSRRLTDAEELARRVFAEENVGQVIVGRDGVTVYPVAGPALFAVHFPVCGLEAAVAALSIMAEKRCAHGNVWGVCTVKGCEHVHGCDDMRHHAAELGPDDDDKAPRGARSAERQIR